MSTARTLGLIVLAVLAIAASVDAAAARHHKRFRVLAPAPHRFVYQEPDGARAAADVGYFGAIFSTGILGPSTADPYDRPIGAYDDKGRLRRGYLYPDYEPN